MINFFKTLNDGLNELFIKITDGDISETYIGTVLDGQQLQQRVEIFKPINNQLPNVLDFGDVYLGSDKIKLGGEDSAPYRVMGATIGANHGYKKTKHPTVGHNKVEVDIGSIWNDGTNNVVLTNIDGDNIFFSRDNDNSGAVSDNLTHVSGATNTSAITSVGFSVVQMYSPLKNHSLVLKIDGVVQVITDGLYSATTDIVFEETYDIMDKDSIMAWLIANVGSVTNNTEYGGTSTISITNTIRYTKTGNTLTNTFKALTNIAAFQDIMFVMGFQLEATTKYPNLKAYIPKTLSFTQDAVSFDFANIRDVDYLPLASRIDITPARAIATDIFCDRHIYLLDGLGFSMGYLPIQDADPTVRRIRANNKAMQLAESGKIYMSAIDDDSKTALTIGDTYSVVAYKQFFTNTTNRTAFYIVDADNGDFYLYADWHNLPYTDSLNIPISLQGKTITLIEKSSNVSYIDSGTTIDVTITSAETYGYLILKL